MAALAADPAWAAAKPLSFKLSDGANFAGGKVAKVDRIEWVSIADAQTAVNALENNEVDALEAVAHDLLARGRWCKLGDRLESHRPGRCRQRRVGTGTGQPFADQPIIRRGGRDRMGAALQQQGGEARKRKTIDHEFQSLITTSNQ